MNICIGSKVISQDEIEVGKIKGIIFYPRLGEVTHLVVHRGVIQPQDTLIPMSMVQGNRDNSLILHITSEETAALPKHGEGVFRKGPMGTEEVAETPAGEVFGVEEPPDQAGQLRQAIHVEPGSVEVTNTTEIQAIDGKLGPVSCLQVDQYTNRLTYITLEKGGQRKKVRGVPFEWVSEVGGDVISLSVPLQQALQGPPPPAGPYIPVEPREEEHYR